MENTTGKIMTVLSGKGGTGASACAVNLATVYALEGKKTLLIDLHTGSRALDLFLGVQDEALYHFGDVTGGLCSLQEAVVPVPGVPGLALLAGCQESGAADPEQIRKLAEECRTLYDRVILDAGNGWTAESEACAAVSGLVLLVTTPDAAALRGTEALEDRLIRGKIRKQRYLVNRVIPALVFKGIEPEVQEIDSRIRCGMAGMILDDENIRASMSAGVPIVTKRDSYIAGNFRRIAERLDTSY
ncbi:MAG: AAA family ATPase [Mogibacterium sp.]|nr:AAA family ATPase [Mogibacterium sp.]